MSNLSDFGERKFIDFALRDQDAPASTYYLGVSTTAFAEDVTPSNAASQEPSDSDYARQVIVFSTADSRTISNNSDIEFPEATESQGSIAYWAIFDGSGNTANTVAQGSFTTARTVATGDVLRVATGDLDISLSSIWGEFWANALLTGFFESDTTASSMAGPDATSTNQQASVSQYYEYPASDGNGYPQPSAVRLGCSTTAFDLSGAGRLNGDIEARQSTNDGLWYYYLQAADSSADDNLMKEPWAPASRPSTLYFIDNDTNPENQWSSTFDNNGYSRPVIAFSAASTSSGTTTLTNSAAISFPEATASWGSIGYWAIFASNEFSDLTSYSSSGTTASYLTSEEIAYALNEPIIAGSFTTAKTVGSGDVLRINAGDFILTPQ